MSVENVRTNLRRITALQGQLMRELAANEAKYQRQRRVEGLAKEAYEAYKERAKAYANTCLVKYIARLDGDEADGDGSGSDSSDDSGSDSDISEVAPGVISSLALIRRSAFAAHLTPDDFPLKLVFCDKSGSMGCSKTTMDALNFVAATSAKPTHGSCFLFLFAGPGEMQVVFTRAAEVVDGASAFPPIQLGCSTWFNEPVFMVLHVLAPIVESLNAQDSLFTTEPPLQVCCITDGSDNMSTPVLGTLPGLADAIAQIKGPESDDVLYTPLGSWGGDALRQVGQNTIPVWLIWVAVGPGAAGLVQQASPGRIAVCDAGFEEAGFALGPAAEEEELGLGATVALKGKGGGVIVSVEPLLVLGDDGALHCHITLGDVKRTAVLPPVQKAAGRPPLLALALVDAALHDPIRLLKNVDADGVVRDVAVRGDLARRVSAARGLLEVKLVATEKPAAGFVQGLLAAVGGACKKLVGGDEEEGARKLLVVVLESLFKGENMQWAVVSEVGVDGSETSKASMLVNSGKIGLVLGDGLASVERMRRISFVVSVMLEYLKKSKVVEIDRWGWVLCEPQRPALVAGLELFRSGVRVVEKCRGAARRQNMSGAVSAGLLQPLKRGSSGRDKEVLYVGSGGVGAVEEERRRGSSSGSDSFRK